MIYSLKEYQARAVEQLKEKIEHQLKNINKGTITSGLTVFKAPTGSGKTFIISSLIEQLVNENEDDNFCFIWCCPGKGDLHRQSYDAVKKYLGGDPVCSLLEDEFFGSRNYIKNNEIVFVNWEKLTMKDKVSGKWANNLMKDQEGRNFIDVIDQTKINKTKIILIVDESHIGASLKTRVNELRETIIIPEITIEMSATPLRDRVDVVVDPQDVIDEGMIKKEIIVNEGISKDDDSLSELDTEEIVLEKGFQKRLQLIKAYKNINSTVNPLVLIQIPNVEAGESKKEIIRDFLQERGITETNGRLKLWCDDHLNFDKKQIKKIMIKLNF